MILLVLVGLGVVDLAPKNNLGVLKGGFVY